MADTKAYFAEFEKSYLFIYLFIFDELKKWEKR